MKTLKNKVQIRFSDGSVIAASTADKVISRWRRKQWHADELNGVTWREELVKRAYDWSVALVDPTLPADIFLMELEKAGLIKIDSNMTGGK
jgi:hypothetical protein